MTRHEQSGRQVALVTGASSGIGRAVATELAAQGMRVFGTSRAPERAEPIPGVELIRLDVTDDASVAAAIGGILDRAGRIDVLVNNAGTGVLGGFEESSIAQMRSLFETNLFGVFRVTRAVLPGMRDRRSGRIINISSVLGFLPAPFFALYAATKHAMEGWSESLDHELRASGVRSILVEPAYTATPFETNAVDADQPIAFYDNGRRSVRVVMQEAMRSADAPKIVADAVRRAATSRRPKLRNPSGPLARRLAFLRRFAPVPMVDGAIRKQSRLER